LGVGPGILHLYGDPHNGYTEILFQFGPLVFIGYIIFYLSLLIKLFNIQKQKLFNGLKYLAEGLWIALVSYSVGCLSDSSRFLSYDSWAIFAMSICVINIYKSQKYSSNATLEV
jgi:O-antigen ligase